MRKYESGRTPLLPLTVIALLAAMTILYLLLQSAPPKPPPVKPPPPLSPPVVVAPPPPPPPPPEPPAPPPEIPEPPQEDPAEAQYARLLEEGRTLAEEGNIEEAITLLESAHELNPTSEVSEVIARLRSILEERERAKQRAAFARLRDAADALRQEDRWDALVEILEQGAEDLPLFRREVDALLQEARTLRDDARKSCDAEVAAARAKMNDGEFPEALRRLQRAAKIYPAHHELAALRSEAMKRLLSSNMVRIPAGTATIGSARVADEGPERAFSHKLFLIDRFEVTNEEYALFIAETGRTAPRSWKGKTAPKGWERHPVVGVSLTDAKAFATWAGKRLPTEEEWEAAARYIDGRTYPWGEEFPENAADIPCNSAEYARAGKVPGVLPVGSLPGGASPFGIHDLAGNVWEWTSTVARDESNREWAVVKGGSFTATKEAVRSSNRMTEDPSVSLPDLGFRCVKDVP
ncbi:MAG: hypothetical protein A2Z34_03835 [Planctomycetes bacterium RBG_16_59_8]|nr:MAG: hypothetical protein A2Z34_03835 [Planctomycetes bacterium RBG_16_59_8]